MERHDLRFQYQQIAQAIKDQILRGEIGPGQRLMSERLLGEHFGVQRNTIRNALSALEQDGHITISKRRGSFVLQPPGAPPDGTVVINIAEDSGPNGAALFSGVACVAKRLGLQIERRSTEPLPHSSIHRVPEPGTLPANTAGVILWPHFPTDIQKLIELNEVVPVVLVDHRLHGAPMDCVRFDDLAGGKLITKYLLDRGHRNIAFLTDEVFAESVQERWEGYTLALDEAGVECDHRLSMLYHFIDPEIFAATMRHLLSEPKSRPTAVVCANDLVAFALLRFLNMEGLRVPEDVAVTGYGNAIPDYTTALSLTTLDQPFYEMGMEACRVVSERAGRQAIDRTRAPQDIRLPVSIVPRGSA